MTQSREKKPFFYRVTSDSIEHCVGNKAEGRMSKWVFQESKARQNLRKTKKCLFFRNFGVLCVLETPVLRFALLLYSRRLNDKFKAH